MKVLEAEIHSASNRSVRSCENMRSPAILSPPVKMYKAANGSGGPPDDGPSGNGDDPEEEPCPSTVYKPSPSPSPAAPIVEETSTTTSRIELPTSTLNEESLRRLHLFPPQIEEFSVFTPVQSEAENRVLAQQEFIQAEADADRSRLMDNELKLKTIASKVHKQSEIDALNNAMAQQKIQDEEIMADTQYRAAESRIRNAEFSLQEEAENARNVVRAEEAAQRLRALEIERQHEYNNEQRLRDESIARGMQQRLIELEHQSRAQTEDLVNLSELIQRENPFKKNLLTRNAFEFNTKKKKGVSEL